MWGSGLMTGPIIGSALYASLGYEKMFYIYGGAEVVFALILRYGVPELNPEDEAEDNEELEPVLKDGKESNRFSNISHSSLSIHGMTHNRVSIYTDKGIHIPIKQVIEEAIRNGD